MQLISSKDRRCWLKQNCIRLTSWIIAILCRSIQTWECMLDFPTGHERHFITCQMATRICLFRRHHALLTSGKKITWRLFASYFHCHTELVPRWTWEMQVLHQKRSSIRDIGYDYTIWSLFAFNGRNERLPTTSNSMRTEVIFSFMQCIPTFRSQVSTSWGQT